jgi:ribosomal protein S18 acetylase RimI-like enzyme
VRRPWRRRGLARALLTRSLKMFQDMGMEEAALGVDTENLSGALRLYESVGFRAVKRQTIYRKAL